jgi:hypothetical protein
MEVVSTQAYYNKATIKAVYSFIAQATRNLVLSQARVDCFQNKLEPKSLNASKYIQPRILKLGCFRLQRSGATTLSITTFSITTLSIILK